MSVLLGYYDHPKMLAIDLIQKTVGAFSLVWNKRGLGACTGRAPGKVPVLHGLLSMAALIWANLDFFLFASITLEFQTKTVVPESLLFLC